MNQNRKSNPSQTKTGFINKKQIQFSQNQEWIVFSKIWHSSDCTHKYMYVCVSEANTASETPSNKTQAS